MAKQQADLKNAFGRIAIAHGMATAKQVEDALKAMEKLQELGMHEKIGAVLVKKGYLAPEQVDEILGIQAKRAAQRIEGYEMISKLGQGAMGAVFKARQISLDRIVALKILSRRLAKDESYVKRFLSEARSVAKLNHPNIIQGIDVGESGGHYYFAMEYVEGVTLADILRDEGPIEEKRALRVMEDMAQALDHAYKNGLVHRDVKPDNIMVTEDGQAKLCDLGLAKSDRGEPSSSSTNVGRVVGTPHYIAPEQARGEEHVDIRADIYSLGATLFHVLAGRTPYSGENPQVVMTKHLTDPLDDPRDIRPELSEGVALLIAKMTAKNSDQRYQVPQEVLEDIRTVLRGKTPAHLVGAFPGARRSGRPAVEHRRPRARAISARRRRSGVTGLVFTLGAVAVAAFVAVKYLPSVQRLVSDDPSRESASVADGDPSDAAADVDDTDDPVDPAKDFYERAVSFAADPENAHKYPEIFRLLRQAVAAGEDSEYAVKAGVALISHGKRQTDERRRRIRRLSAEAAGLIEQGKIREAHDLWDGFPENLLPESRTAAQAILDSRRKRVLQAAEKRFDALLGQAHREVASGRYGRARSLLKDAERIGLGRLTSRLPAERRRLEAAIAKRRAEVKKSRLETWETRLEEILALAEAADYEGAQIMAREAALEKTSRDHLKEFEALRYDMARLALRQEFAMEGLALQLGKGRVVVHKDGRGYAGTVVKAEGGRITVQPAMPRSEPVVIIRQDLEPEDIRKHAPIVFSEAEGQYDYAILLIYSGKPKMARPLLERCLSSREFADRARRHLERVERVERVGE